MENGTYCVAASDRENKFVDFHDHERKTDKGLFHFTFKYFSCLTLKNMQKEFESFSHFLIKMKCTGIQKNQRLQCRNTYWLVNKNNNSENVHLSLTQK